MHHRGQRQGFKDEAAGGVEDLRFRVEFRVLGLGLRYAHGPRGRLPDLRICAQRLLCSTFLGVVY